MIDKLRNHQNKKNIKIRFLQIFSLIFFEKKFHEKYISIFGLQSPVIVNKCELNLTAGTSWILPRIPSTTLREEKKNEETKHFENLKLLKGPSRY